MNDTAIQIAEPIPRNDFARERPIPVWFSLLAAWIAPRWTARRTLTARLKFAWLIHVLSVLFVFAIILLATAIAENRYQFEGLTDRIKAGWSSYKIHFQTSPVDKVLGIVGPALGIEGVFFGLAFLLMPWGAQDEPMKKSLAHSIRQVWLRTSHAIPIAVLIATASLAVDRIKYNWSSEHPSPKLPMQWRVFAQERFPLSIDPNYPAVMALNRVQAEIYERAAAKWSAEYQARSWYLQHEELVYIPLIFSSIGWFVWGLFRAVGTQRESEPIVRPPTCEFCGYDLTTMPIDSRCPECGRDIIDSLGMHNRPGAPWEHRKEIGRARAWWRTLQESIRRPQNLGLNLHACEPQADHRGFIALHLPLIFLIAASGTPVLFYVKAVQLNPPNQTPDLGIETFTIGAPIFGTLCTLGALAATLVVAGKAAFEFVLRDKRNLLAVSMQASAYLMPYLVIWEFFGAVTAIWCTWLMDTPWMKNLFHTRSVNRSLVCFMIWFIPNVTLGIYYMVLVRRITRAARWANK